MPVRAVPAAVALAAVSALMAASTLLAAPARADLKLCNTTPNRVGVALGYGDASGALTTEGWWNLPGLTCETLYKGPLTSRYWYVHAVDYDGGGEWTGQAFLCTLDKAFTIKNGKTARNAVDCAKDGYNRTGFFEVDVEDATDWTIRLTDPSEGGAKPR